MDRLVFGLENMDRHQLPFHLDATNFDRPLGPLAADLAGSELTTGWGLGGALRELVHRLGSRTFLARNTHYVDALTLLSGESDQPDQLFPLLGVVNWLAVFRRPAVA